MIMTDDNTDLLCRVIAAFFGEGYHVATHGMRTSTAVETSPVDRTGQVPKGARSRVRTADHIEVEIRLKKVGEWRDAPEEVEDDVAP